MSYNSGPFHHRPSMSRGGPGRGSRGYNRGGRGSSDSSTWRGRGRGSRGFSSSGRGGGSSYPNNDGAWYAGDTAPAGPKYRTDRYSSGPRSGDRYVSTSSTEYGRKMSRPDAQNSYSSSRDRNRTPDPIPRKRIRTDPYPSASRRSRDGSHEYNSSHCDYGSDKGSFSSEERSRQGLRRPSADRRDGYESPRAREHSANMPPPSVSTTVYRPRASTRGRTLTRGTRVPMSSVRYERGFHYKSTRERFVSARPEYVRRMRNITKLRSAPIAARRDKLNEESFDSEEDDIYGDDEDEVGEKVEGNKVANKEAEMEGEGTSKTVIRNASKKVVKKKPVVSSEDGPANEEEKDLSKNLSADVDPEEREENSFNELENDEPKMQVTIKQDSEARSVSEDASRKFLKGSGSKPSYNKFIKLICPHCKVRYVRFKEYQSHLRSGLHTMTMKKLSLKLKQILMRMRTEQRFKQKLDEKNDESRGVLGSQTIFCPICKLNYRQERSKHTQSDMHKKMKEFLMPPCLVCRMSFKSPMQYENHISSLDHIKKEENIKRVHEDEKDIDMVDMLILDSVESEDESNDEGEAGDDKEKDKPKERRKKQQLKLGAEFVKTLEVKFCELCELYLPRATEQDAEEALASHCRSRNHLQRYVRDRSLRQEAERIHRQEQAELEASKPKVKDEKLVVETQEDSTVKVNEKEESTNVVSVEEDSSNTDLKETTPVKSPGDPANESLEIDDKIWEHVSKLPDELQGEEDGGNKSSDEEDVEGRFDRTRVINTTSPQ